MSLRSSTHGTIAVPREWTDKADPKPYESVSTLSPTVLSFTHLLQLVELTSVIKHVKGIDQ